jgi:PPIC-type PPIASE domain
MLWICCGSWRSLSRSTIVPTQRWVSQVIFCLKPGERTGIFRTADYGYHIAELRQKIPAGPMPFEEVREDIRRVLTRIREHREYLRVVTAMRAAADIRWVPETSPARDRPAGAAAPPATPEQAETPQPERAAANSANAPKACSASL